MKTVRPRSRAFVLVEAVTLVVMCVVVVAIVAVASKRSRSLASLGESMANLRQMHQATAQYGDDYAGRFATFSWRKGPCPSQYADLKNASSDLDAAAKQAVDIIRRRAGFTAAQFPPLSGWVPHPNYTLLVLVDYLGQALPMRSVISPADEMRLAFASDRSQWVGGSMNVRWAFSSSYEVPVAFWSATEPGSSVYQSGAYNLYYIPSLAQFGTRRLNEVVYPSNKAVYYDRHQRHFGPRQGFFMHEEARVPVATVDGAVSVRRGADANPGWLPNDPTNPNPTYITYQPAPLGQFSWDPPALDPSGIDLVVGRYRFTRGALAGRDVDGPEVP